MFRRIFIIVICTSLSAVNAQQPPDTLWTRTYGTERGDIGRDGIQTNDGGFLLVGETQRDSTGIDVYMIKTDAYGDTQWTNYYGGLNSEYGRKCLQTPDINYII